jgi:small-conductance mechanosensitive channel
MTAPKPANTPAKTFGDNRPALDQLSQFLTEAGDWISSHVNQIILAIVAGTIIIGLLYGAKLFGIWLCRPGKVPSRWPEVIGRALAKTKLWFMAAVAGQVIIWLGKAPAEVSAPIHAIFIIAAALQAAIWVRSLILGMVSIRAEETDPNGSLQSAVGLIRLLVTVVVLILAAIVILANLGVDVTGLLAGLGIGGIAIGLAAQGIFSDLFAALSILFDKPFRKGDTIRWDTTTGTVEAIGLKSSRIRALSGEEIIISNANLLGKELRNFARVETRRHTQLLSLVYRTPPEQCAGLGDLIAPLVNGVDGCTFIRCGLETFAASSLDFTLIYDIEAEDPDEILACKNKVNIAILRMFEDQGLAFAYPTQTTYTAAPDGTLVMPYAAASPTNIVQRQK